MVWRLPIGHMPPLAGGMQCPLLWPEPASASLEYTVGRPTAAFQIGFGDNIKVGVGRRHTG